MAEYDGEPALIWRKSSRSNSAGCLEVAFTKGSVLLRDSKHPRGLVLSFSLHEWSAFITRVHGSAFDVTS